MFQTSTDNNDDLTDNNDDFFPIIAQQPQQQKREQIDTEGVSNVDGDSSFSSSLIRRSTSNDSDNIINNNGTAAPITTTISCTICLVDYDDGDQVCFSHNPKCTHHFHKECIIEWLRDHDECPCCRCNYLAFSDDGNDDDDENNERDDYFGFPPPGEALLDASALFLARLFQATDSSWEIQAQPSSSQSPVHSSPRMMNHNNNVDGDDGYFDRGSFEGRWRSEMQERVRISQRRLEEQREASQRRRGGQLDHDNNSQSSSFEQGIDRSMELARNQFSRFRQHLSDRDISGENVLRSVRDRFQEVSNSESARQLRDRSQRTIETIRRQVSSSHRDDT